VEGKRDSTALAEFTTSLPLHHPLRGRSPSPSKLWED